MWDASKGDAALAVMNAEDAWIYNNVFYANSGADTRSVIMFRGNYYPVGPGTWGLSRPNDRS